MDFGKEVKNELSFLFTTRTIMEQVLIGYLLFSSIYNDYSCGTYTVADIVFTIFVKSNNVLVLRKS